MAQSCIYNTFISGELNIRPSDKVGIKFIRNENDTFSLSFRRFDQYSASLITSSISRILQSNAQFLFHENLIVEVAHIQSDVGYGRIHGLEGCSLENYVKRHSSIFFGKAAYRKREIMFGLCFGARYCAH